MPYPLRQHLRSSRPASGAGRNFCAVAVIALLSLGACGNQPSLDKEALMDPVACQSCHPQHYKEWAGSMHAYASTDPVFLALNQLGQRETDGALGDFCIGCHAPMAVRTGATTDGLNMESLPRPMQGITCYFCHSVDSVLGDHNNQLGLATDGVMRGGIADPLYTEAHKSGYSPLHNGRDLTSSDMCGSCHDVITPAGVPAERTYGEWKDSLFAKPGPGSLSCNGCHMPGTNGVAADVSGAPDRRLHEHAWPGIDIALSRWPETDAQLDLIARDLRPALAAELCVTQGVGGVIAEVKLDNIFAGHMFPSGVTHARRAWVELIAKQGDTVLFQSGVVAEDEAVTKIADPNLWLLRTRLFGEDGSEVHTAWAARDATSELLAPAVTNDPADPAYYHAKTRQYTIPGTPDRVEIRMLMRPVGLEMLDDLIASGDLAAEVRARMPTFNLDPINLVWNSTLGFGCVR